MNDVYVQLLPESGQTQTQQLRQKLQVPVYENVNFQSADSDKMTASIPCLIADFCPRAEAPCWSPEPRAWMPLFYPCATTSGGSYLERAQGTLPFLLTLQDPLHKVNIEESPDFEVKQLPAG